MRIKYHPTVPNSLNSSLTFRYNAETDYFQALINGVWTNWKKAGFKEPIAFIPVMSSDTCSECTVSASSYLSGEEPYRAFDDNIDTRWQTNWNAVPGWLQVKFNEEKIVTRVHAYLNTATTVNQQCILQASKDGSSWTDLVTMSVGDVTKDIQNSKPYMYYRLYSASGYNNSGSSVSSYTTFQLYGY